MTARCAWLSRRATCRCGHRPPQATLYGPNWTPIRDYDFTQGGYSVWNLMLRYRIDPRWTVTLNVNNVFDKVYYQTLGYASGSNYYGAPRNAVLTLRGQF